MSRVTRRRRAGITRNRKVFGFKRGRGVTSRKEVARIATRVVHRNEETKKFFHSTELSIVDNANYVYNPMFQLFQGLTSSTMLGQKLSNVNLRVDWTFWPRGIDTNVVPNLRQWQGGFLRLLFVKSNVRVGLTTTTRFLVNPAGMTGADTTETGASCATESVNTEKFTVISDTIRRWTFPADTTTVLTAPRYGIPIRGRQFINIAKEWTYESEPLGSGGFGRNRQFYMVVAAMQFGAPAGLNNCGDFQCSITTMFKDS